MSWRHSLAIARHEARILRADGVAMLSLILMPVVMIGFLKPVFRASTEGEFGGGGGDYAVPAMTVLFAFFLTGFVGYQIFAEHRWNTWERLRASQARNAEIMIGKMLPALGLAAVQQTFLFGAGIVLFGMQVRGSLVGVLAIVASLSLCLVGLGVLLAAILKNEQQLNAIANLGAMVLGGLGGALVPLSALPDWARTVAPATPQYWAIRGFRDLILEGKGLDAAVLPVIVLLGITAILGGLGLLRFRFDEPKVVTVR